MVRNLASPRTDLGGFFRGLERYTGALVPVAAQNASLFGHLDTTFTALAGIAYPYLQNWISETPPTFQTVISDSPSLQSFLERRGRAVRAAAARLRHAAAERPGAGGRVRRRRAQPAGHPGAQPTDAAAWRRG